MNLYYAIGGGLGHLTRAAAFLHSRKISDSTIILTASPYAADKRVVGNIKTIIAGEDFAKNLESYKKFLQKTFVENNIRNFFLDTFPVGIIGEFSGFDFQNIEINYIARLLRWERYKSFLRGDSPLFNHTFVLEDLEKPHRDFIESSSKTASDLTINYPPPLLSETDKKIVQNICENRRPFWLIVHSGSSAEISELTDYAREIKRMQKSEADLILITSQKTEVENLLCFDLYPASVLFEAAEKVFTACGFNLMNELKNFRFKHYFMPFERRFDNQFRRAEIARFSRTVKP